MLGICLSPALAQGTFKSYYDKGNSFYATAKKQFNNCDQNYKATCDKAIGQFRLARQKTKVKTEIESCDKMISACTALKNKTCKIISGNGSGGSGGKKTNTGRTGGSGSGGGTTPSSIPDWKAIKIVDIEFCNADKQGNNLTEYGSRLFSNTQYLTGKVYFNNTVKEARRIDIRVKLFRPDGTMSGGTEGDYTFDDYLRTDGQFKQGDFDVTTGWGNENGTSYSPGGYRYEIWIGSHLMFTKEFTVFAADSNPSNVTPSNTAARGMQSNAWRTALLKLVENPSRTFGGDPYKGGMYNNDCQSFGAYYWKKTESFYFGNWDNGLRDGDGVHICGPEYYICGKSDAAIYVGPYSAGDMADGKGTLYDERGNLLYYGAMSNGKPTETYPSTGDWSEFKFEYLQYNDGACYIGETYKGNRHGFGVYIWKNKDFWIGYWKEDQRKGSGLYVFYNGNVQTGTWDGDTRTE